MVTVGAAATALELRTGKGRTQFLFGYGRLARLKHHWLGAGFAHSPHQPLRQNAAQAGGNQKWRRAHVEQARDGRNGIIGMQCGQHQMAGHGGAQANLGGFLIAHFADQDNVRILAQH